MPRAPSFISRCTSSRIACSCAVVAGLSSRPMTCSRSVAAPMNDAKFGVTPRFSRSSMPSCSVDHSMGYFRSPWPASRRVRIGVGDRSHRVALAEYFGRHSLLDVAHRSTVGPERIVARHHVDESRRDREAVGPDRCLRLGVVKIADRLDRVADDPDVGAGARIARSVVDRSAGDNHIEPVFRRRRACPGSRRDRTSQRERQEAPRGLSLYAKQSFRHLHRVRIHAAGLAAAAGFRTKRAPKISTTVG